MTAEWLVLTRDNGSSIFVRARLIQAVEPPSNSSAAFRSCLHLEGGNVIGVKEAVPDVLRLLGVDNGLIPPPRSRPRPVGSAA